MNKLSFFNKKHHRTTKKNNLNINKKMSKDTIIVKMIKLICNLTRILKILGKIAKNLTILQCQMQIIELVQFMKNY